MTRTITAIFQIRFQVSEAMTHQALERQIAASLRQTNSKMQGRSKISCKILAVEDPTNGSLQKAFDIHSYLREQREIAVIWQIDDVLEVRSDLSKEDAWQALQFAERCHDANFGLNWEAIEAAAYSLYGPSSESASQGVAV